MEIDNYNEPDEIVEFGSTYEQAYGNEVDIHGD